MCLESADKTAVTDAKIKLANVEEKMCVLDERASMDRPMMLSAFEDRNDGHEDW